MQLIYISYISINGQASFEVTHSQETSMKGRKPFGFYTMKFSTTCLSYINFQFYFSFNYHFQQSFLIRCTDWSGDMPEFYFYRFQREKTKRSKWWIYAVKCLYFKLKDSHSIRFLSILTTLFVALVKILLSYVKSLQKNPDSKWLVRAIQILSGKSINELMWAYQAPIF